MALWSAYQMSAGSSLALVIVLFVAAVLFLMVMQIYPVLVVTYDLKLRHHFRNALLLCLLKIPAFAGVFLGTHFILILGIVFFILYPGTGYINLLIPVVYYSVIGFATTELACASLANKMCDTYFNSEPEQADN